MKFYTNMPATLKPYFNAELLKAEMALTHQQYLMSWRHLERAHILGQPYPAQHSLVHYKMIRFGCKVKNWKEVLGQIPRLLFGGVKSFVGRIPVGNTGGANVSALAPMKIPDDLQAIINNAKE